MTKHRYSNDETPISCTPEGEDYFKKQAEQLFRRVNEGQLRELDIEVPAHVAEGIQPSESGSDLVVKPVTFASETEVEVMTLNFEPGLIVKPVDIRQDPYSSYEAIYDRVTLEEIPSEKNLSTTEIMTKLGDKFHGTHQIPEITSSFEELYENAAQDMAGHILTSAMSNLPDSRWSAPVGSVEAPILEEDEFQSRYGLVQHSIDHHWQQIQDLLSDDHQAGQHEGGQGRQE